MLMVAETLTNLIEIAKISTCVSNAKDEVKSESIIKLTENLMMKSSYEFDVVDYRLIGPDAWPNETFNSIQFELIRGSEPIYTLKIDDTLKKEASPDALCGTSMPLDIKLAWLKKFKPKMSDGIRFSKVKLTREEEFAISEIADKMKMDVAEMLQPQSGRKK